MLAAVDPDERARYELARRRANAGRPRRRLWAAVLAPDPLYCALCSGRIDKTLQRTGRAPHPMSACVDHIVEIADGGDPLDPDNLQPAHRRCNGEKEARRAAARAADPDGEFIARRRQPPARLGVVERPRGTAPIVGADP